MQKTFCNGCGGGPLNADQCVRVDVLVATMPGPWGTDTLGTLATDARTSGVLCLPCVAAIKEFLGESDDKETALDAAHVVRALPVAV